MDGFMAAMETTYSDSAHCPGERGITLQILLPQVSILTGGHPHGVLPPTASIVYLMRLTTIRSGISMTIWGMGIL